MRIEEFFYTRKARLVWLKKFQDVRQIARLKQQRYLPWSSLIYNTSARHERPECDTSNMNATRVQH